MTDAELIRVYQDLSQNYEVDDAVVAMIHAVRRLEARVNTEVKVLWAHPLVLYCTLTR